MTCACLVSGQEFVRLADGRECVTCACLVAGQEFVRLADGRDLCLQCLDSIVVDTNDAQPLYSEVGGKDRGGGG